MGFIEYRSEVLRVVDYLSTRTSADRMADIRSLVEHNEAPIALGLAAWVISSENLSVPDWVISDIRRLLAEWPEELAELPDDGHRAGDAGARSRGGPRRSRCRQHGGAGRLAGGRRAALGCSAGNGAARGMSGLEGVLYDRRPEALVENGGTTSSAISPLNPERGLHEGAAASYLNRGAS